MKEEYLWDKTGGDVEIEGLENALKTFSYRTIAPPGLPAKSFVLEQKPQRRFVRLGFAFAAAAVVILAGVWFLIPDRNVAVGKESMKAAVPQASTVRQTTAPPATKVELPKLKDTSTIIKTRHPIRQATRPINAVAFKTKDINPPVAFTDEEKYAYGQLMLALSITESKLKIVKDAITGNEEMKTVVEKEKNLYQK